MTIENRMTYTEDQCRALIADDDKGPVCMVNLLKFREKAVYEDGRDTDLSGFEAYDLYGRPMGELIRANGGKVVYTSLVTGLFVGAAEENWDIVVIVEYPSRSQFLELIQSDEAAVIQVHRHAGLAGQLNLATAQI